METARILNHCDKILLFKIVYELYITIIRKCY